MRETGVVHMFLGTDEDTVADAKPYVGIARTQLGITKNLMKLGGLGQLTRRVVLADGAILICQSVLGQDIISITPPARDVAAPAPAPAKKIQKLPAVYQWTRLADGPMKNGHQSVWDVENARLLVYSGYDRGDLVLSGLARVDPTFHYDSSLTGQYVSQVFDFGGGGPPAAPWGSGTYNAQGITYTAEIGYANDDAGAEAAIAAAGHGSGWTKIGIVYFAVPQADYYGNIGFGGTLIEWQQTVGGSNLAVYTSYHPDVVVWDTYGYPAETGGDARYALARDVTNADSTLSGYHDTNSGGWWFDAAGTSELGTFREGDPSLTYESVSEDEWKDHADAYLLHRFGNTSLASGIAPSGVRSQDTSLTGPHSFDLWLSGTLWQFTEFGGWEELSDISLNDWEALVASIEANELAWGRNYSQNHTVAYGGDFPGDAIKGHTDTGYYLDNTFNDYVEYVFGGSKDGTDRDGMSKQLWRYSGVSQEIEVDDV